MWAGGSKTRGSMCAAAVVQHAGLPGRPSYLFLARGFCGARAAWHGTDGARVPSSDGSRMRFQELSRFSTRASCSGSQNGGRFLGRECYRREGLLEYLASWSGDGTSLEGGRGELPPA